MMFCKFVDHSKRRKIGSCTVTLLLFQLTEVSVIEWSPTIFADSISFAISTILEESKIFDTTLTKGNFIKKLEQVVEEQDRIDLTKLFVHIAQARRESVNKIMNR